MCEVNKVSTDYINDYDGKRPIIKLWNGLTVLIDTGADRNIWYGDIELIDKIKLNKGLDNYIIEVNGISNTSVKVRPYFIPFNLNGYKFSEMHILVPINPISDKLYDMIIGMESLSSIKVTIDAEERKVTMCSDSVDQEDGILSLINKGVSIEEVFGCYSTYISEDKNLTGNAIKDEDMLDIKKLFEDAWNS